MKPAATRSTLDTSTSPRRVVLRLDSFDDLIEYVDRPWGMGAMGKCKKMHDDRRRRVDPADREWFGLPERQRNDDTRPVLAFVREFATQGWPEGMERVERLRAALPELPAPTSTKRRRRNADFGDSCDMGRVWAGDLDRAWTRCARESVRAPAPITVAVQMGCPSSADADSMAWRALSALTIADSLQAAGYAVQVLGYWLSDYWQRHDEPAALCDTRITIKPFTAPLDVASAVATLAHPASIRGAFYAAWVRAAAEHGIALSMGLTNGHSRTDHSIDAEFGRTIHMAVDDATTPESAAQFIADALAPFVESSR